MSQIIKLNGNFEMDYVPEDKIYDHGTNYRLPLTARFTLEDTSLGINGTDYYSVGASFMPHSYLDQILDLYDGEQTTITLNEHRPIPLSFHPKGNLCSIGLDKSSCTRNISFDKKKIQNQVVSLEDTIFKLANFLNQFFNDLDSRGAYNLLDELEEEVGELFYQATFQNIFSKYGIQQYQFDQSDSAERSFNQLKNKQEVLTNYSEFVESLSPRQNRDWENALIGLKKLYPDKSDKELYSIAHLGS